MENSNSKATNEKSNPILEAVDLTKRYEEFY